MQLEEGELGEKFSKDNDDAEDGEIFEIDDDKQGGIFPADSFVEDHLSVIEDLIPTRVQPVLRGKEITQAPPRLILPICGAEIGKYSEQSLKNSRPPPLVYPHDVAASSPIIANHSFPFSQHQQQTSFNFASSNLSNFNCIDMEIEPNIGMTRLPALTSKPFRPPLPPPPPQPPYRKLPPPPPPCTLPAPQLPYHKLPPPPPQPRILAAPQPPYHKLPPPPPPPCTKPSLSPHHTLPPVGNDIKIKQELMAIKDTNKINENNNNIITEKSAAELRAEVLASMKKQNKGLTTTSTTTITTDDTTEAIITPTTHKDYHFNNNIMEVHTDNIAAIIPITMITTVSYEVPAANNILAPTTTTAHSIATSLPPSHLDGNNSTATIAPTVFESDFRSTVNGMSVDKEVCQNREEEDSLFPMCTDDDHLVLSNASESSLVQAVTTPSTPSPPYPATVCIVRDAMSSNMMVEVTTANTTPPTPPPPPPLQATTTPTVLTSLTSTVISTVATATTTTTTVSSMLNESYESIPLFPPIIPEIQASSPEATTTENAPAIINHTVDSNENNSPTTHPLPGTETVTTMVPSATNKNKENTILAENDLPPVDNFRDIGNINHKNNKNFTYNSIDSINNAINDSTINVLCKVSSDNRPSELASAAMTTATTTTISKNTSSSHLSVISVDSTASSVARPNTNNTNLLLFQRPHLTAQSQKLIFTFKENEVLSLATPQMPNKSRKRLRKTATTAPMSTNSQHDEFDDKNAIPAKITFWNPNNHYDNDNEGNNGRGRGSRNHQKDKQLPLLNSRYSVISNKHTNKMATLPSVSVSATSTLPAGTSGPVTVPSNPSSVTSSNLSHTNITALKTPTRRTTLSDPVSKSTSTTAASTTTSSNRVGDSRRTNTSIASNKLHLRKIAIKRSIHLMKQKMQLLQLEKNKIQQSNQSSSVESVSSRKQADCNDEDNMRDGSSDVLSLHSKTEITSNSSNNTNNQISQIRASGVTSTTSKVLVEEKDQNSVEEVEPNDEYITSNTDTNTMTDDAASLQLFHFIDEISLRHAALQTLKKRSSPPRPRVPASSTTGPSMASSVDDDSIASSYQTDAINNSNCMSAASHFDSNHDLNSLNINNNNNNNEESANQSDVTSMAQPLHATRTLSADAEEEDFEEGEIMEEENNNDDDDDDVPIAIPIKSTAAAATSTPIKNTIEMLNLREAALKSILSKSKLRKENCAKDSKSNKKNAIIKPPLSEAVNQHILPTTTPAPPPSQYFPLTRSHCQSTGAPSVTTSDAPPQDPTAGVHAMDVDSLAQIEQQQQQEDPSSDTTFCSKASPPPSPPSPVKTLCNSLATESTATSPLPPPPPPPSHKYTRRLVQEEQHTIPKIPSHPLHPAISNCNTIFSDHSNDNIFNEDEFPPLTNKDALQQQQSQQLKSPLIPTSITATTASKKALKKAARIAAANLKWAMKNQQHLTAAATAIPLASVKTVSSHTTTEISSGTTSSANLTSVVMRDSPLKALLNNYGSGSGVGSYGVVTVPPLPPTIISTGKPLHPSPYSPRNNESFPPSTPTGNIPAISTNPSITSYSYFDSDSKASNQKTKAISSSSSSSSTSNTSNISSGYAVPVFNLTSPLNSTTTSPITKSVTNTNSITIQGSDTHNESSDVASPSPKKKQKQQHRNQQRRQHQTTKRKLTALQQGANPSSDTSPKKLKMNDNRAVNDASTSSVIEPFILSSTATTRESSISMTSVSRLPTDVTPLAPPGNSSKTSSISTTGNAGNATTTVSSGNNHRSNSTIMPHDCTATPTDATPSARDNDRFSLSHTNGHYPITASKGSALSITTISTTCTTAPGATSTISTTTATSSINKPPVVPVDRDQLMSDLKKREKVLKGVMASKAIKKEIQCYENLLMDQTKKAESEQSKLVSALRVEKSQVMLRASKADLYRVDLLTELAAARLQLTLFEKSEEASKAIEKHTLPSSSQFPSTLTTKTSSSMITSRQL